MCGHRRSSCTILFFVALCFMLCAGDGVMLRAICVICTQHAFISARFSSACGLRHHALSVIIVMLHSMKSHAATETQHTNTARHTVVRDAFWCKNGYTVLKKKKKRNEIRKQRNKNELQIYPLLLSRSIHRPLMRTTRELWNFRFIYTYIYICHKSTERNQRKVERGGDCGLLPISRMQLFAPSESVDFICEPRFYLWGIFGLDHPYPFSMSVLL